MRKIFDIKEMTIYEKIALGIVCIILLSIGTALLSSTTKKDNNVNYKEFSLDEILNSSEEIKAREEYWTLNDIIYSFLSSYNLEISSTGLVNNSNNTKTYTRESYYKVLSSDYRKYLKKSKYMELSKNMMEKFVQYSNNKIYIKDSDIISNIYLLNEYEYGNDMYICKLNTVKIDTTSYIGIQLLENNTYTIFYIE